MTIIVFCGPTIEATAVQRVLPEAMCLGPAARGDVYLACKNAPAAIALIDGYFDHRLAVWHKEVLWALSSGIRVYGAASMGALRAAELELYGMVGVGAVYQAFVRGELEDDDEVAVLHAPEGSGYIPQSDAMVNIRATLRAALAAGVIDSEDEATLVASAKATYYPDRSLARLVAGWAPEAPRTRLAAWLAEHGMVDQKRRDALALLSVLHQHARQPAFVHRRERFRLANTHYWQVLRQSLDSPQPTPSVAAPSRPPASRGEETARADAAHRALALALATLSGAEVSAAEAQQASEQFRREHGLLTPESTAQWLLERAMDLQSFSLLARERVLIQRFAAAATAATEQQQRRLGTSPGRASDKR